MLTHHTPPYFGNKVDNVLKHCFKTPVLKHFFLYFLKKTCFFINGAAGAKKNFDLEEGTFVEVQEFYMWSIACFFPCVVYVWPHFGWSVALL